MVLILNIGRRVPRSWFKRQTHTARGLISFQTNIWSMINQSMKLAKRKCNASGRGKWIMSTEIENEDMHYQIEWLKIIVQGDEAFEKEEYEDAQNLYKAFGKTFKKEFIIPSNNSLRKQFKTKVLSKAKVDEAYKKGYGAISDNNIANKMLEMGILTHLELIKDYDSRSTENTKINIE